MQKTLWLYDKKTKTFLTEIAHGIAYSVFLGSLHLRVFFLSKRSGPFLKEWLGRCSDLCLRTQSRSPGGCDTWAERSFRLLSWPIGALLIALYTAKFYFFLLFLAVTDTRPPPPGRMRRRWGGIGGPAPPRALPRRPRAAPRSRWRPGRLVRWRGRGGRAAGPGPVPVPIPVPIPVPVPEPPGRWVRAGQRGGPPRGEGAGELGCTVCPWRGQRVPLPLSPGESPRWPCRGSGGSLAPVPELSGLGECSGALEEPLGCSWGAWGSRTCADTESAHSWSKVIPYLALKDEGITK